MERVARPKQEEVKLMEKWRARAGRRKGQSTLEYVLIVAAIVAAIIVAAQALMQPAVNQLVVDSTTAIKNSTSKLVTSLKP